MKTIRHNCFETNSSSTHSITIIDTRLAPAKQTVQLCPLGTLMPKVLNQTTAYTKIGEYYDSSWKLTARTSYEKAALLIHHIWSYVGEGMVYDIPDAVETGKDTKLKDIVINSLINKVDGIVDIDFGDFDYTFPHYSEGGASYIKGSIDYCHKTKLKDDNWEDNFRELIEKLIDDIIIPEYIYIECSEESNY